jgi:hypothetical protein
MREHALMMLQSTSSRPCSGWNGAGRYLHTDLAWVSETGTSVRDLQCITTVWLISSIRWMQSREVGLQSARQANSMHPLWDQLVL